MQTHVVFSHANGLPAKSYQKFLNNLDRFPLEYINAYGMGTFPIDTNWRSSVDELIDFVERKFSRPVIALGHSFGGVIGLFAASLRPELFEQVISIDPPLFGKKKRWAIGLTRLMGIEKLIFPFSEMARTRRSSFHSKIEALEYFQKKSFFKKFDPRCLKDYVEHGLTKTVKGFELTIPTQVETDIFKKMPCFFIPRLSEIKPCTILYATAQGMSFDKNDLEWLQKSIKHVRLIPYQGGHMAPFENPELMATLVNDLIP